MTEFENVLELLAKGDVEKAASEFSNAVYARASVESENSAEQEEEENES